MTLLTQLQVEARMYAGGIKRANDMMKKAEDAGRAHQNPYAKEVFSTYVLPLADAIRAELVSTRAGRQQAHVGLLRPLDPEQVALLAVHTTLSHLMGQPLSRVITGTPAGEHNTRNLSQAIGKMVYQEIVLAQVEADMPDLYNTLVQDLGRRMSKNERHRVTVMRMQAQKNGLTIVDWPRGANEQVGSYILGMLEVAEMVEIGDRYRFQGRDEYRPVYLGRSLLERIETIKEYVSKSMPVWGPCVERPRDWDGPVGGGFHSVPLRRLHSLLVRGGSESREYVRKAAAGPWSHAANILQATPWRVNTRLLAALRLVGDTFNLKEVVSAHSNPKPDRPVFCETVPPEDMTPAQMAEFKSWKHAMAEWYTQRKLLGAKVGRLTSTLAAADMFAEYPELYFVYFADTRGRMYPMTYGLNPQGSDMQKSLLMFAKGKPVNTPDAVKWFHVQGANKYGFDKATLAERQQWVIDRQELILGFADSPRDNAGWKAADKPLQFLAWCFEYADWVRDTTGEFVSHLPISMDGSCNGLQNLSAMLRDEIGGSATNLTPNVVMRDIYADVAKAATIRLEAITGLSPEEEVIRIKWLQHKINRKVVKRAVMTTPYGVTSRSAMKYVISDYLAEGYGLYTFTKEEYRAAAKVLMLAVWPAIGDVVVKGREAMAWLKAAPRSIVKSWDTETPPVITWNSPSGFPASQSYFEETAHRINTRLHGVTKIQMLSETDTPDGSRHSSGMAPNFVHSMDAAHLHLSANAAAGHGIDALAMIHDDYGTHAADSQLLYTLIRQEFVGMYERNDPIRDFHTRYPTTKKPPAMGTLDIRGVLDSPFFFS